jgi:ferritin-like metal-binding protein YciE
MATRTGRGATATRMRTAARARTQPAARTRSSRGGMRLDSLRTLFIEELRDLYDAEHQILKALPKMINAASHDEVKHALEEHRRQTEEHVHRLERVFEECGAPARASRCEGMAGIIQEGTEVVQAAADRDVRDAGLIASAQRVEHYEMAGYGTVRTYAHQLNMQDAAGLLQRTLDEEKQADRHLTEIAEQAVNVRASEGDEEIEAEEEEQ